jgi:hypothetical protein
VAVPKAQFGDDPASLEVLRVDATDSTGSVHVAQIHPGERATAVAHAAPSLGGQIGLAVYLARENAGEDIWPAAVPDSVSLLVYPGALQPLPAEVNGVALATTDGMCLVDAGTGKEYSGGFGGNVPQYFALDPGSTDIAVAFFPRSDCHLEPEAGTVTVDGQAGERFALIPWGPSGDKIQLLLIDLGNGS